MMMRRPRGASASTQMSNMSPPTASQRRRDEGGDSSGRWWGKGSALRTPPSQARPIAMPAACRVCGAASLQGPPQHADKRPSSGPLTRLVHHIDAPGILPLQYRLDVLFSVADHSMAAQRPEAGASEAREARARGCKSGGRAHILAAPATERPATGKPGGWQMASCPAAARQAELVPRSAHLSSSALAPPLQVPTT